MRRSFGLLSAGLLSSLAWGCGPSLGEPKAPTSSQSQAAKQLDGTSGQVTQLKADRGAAFSLYGSVFALGPQAVDFSAKVRSGLHLGPAAVDDKCVSGDSATGWTYSCPEVTGTVKFDGATTTIDLKITASSGGSTETTFKGAVTNDGSRITGDLTAEVKFVGFSIPGVPSADVRTHVNYDISYQSAPTSCITAGKVLVEYSAAGQGGSAQFEYTGCNTFMVRNG